MKIDIVNNINTLTTEDETKKCITTPSNKLSLVHKKSTNISTLRLFPNIINKEKEININTTDELSPKQQDSDRLSNNINFIRVLTLKKLKTIAKEQSNKEDLNLHKQKETESSEETTLNHFYCEKYKKIMKKINNLKIRMQKNNIFKEKEIENILLLRKNNMIEKLKSHYNIEKSIFLNKLNKPNDQLLKQCIKSSTKLKYVDVNKTNTIYENKTESYLEMLKDYSKERLGKVKNLGKSSNKIIKFNTENDSILTNNKIDKVVLKSPPLKKRKGEYLKKTVLGKMRKSFNLKHKLISTIINFDNRLQ